MSSADLTPTTKSPTRTARSHSISSDRTSLTGYGGLFSPPLFVTPEASFIAASAASQIVTNDHDSRADTWFDQHGIEPSGETALVSPPALKLINQFLDQLLFNFLSTARSTSLASLRPAVREVLKTKLAKDAISLADQELHEYLGGGEDEELESFHNGIEPTRNWDQELVWKRTRLRCMVYSSLGDMEEEDEDLYTEQQHLDGPEGYSNRFSGNPGVVSPAVAIFLTSILEYMGEQLLVVAGHSAYHRLRAKHEKEEREGTSSHGEIAERVVVQEFDMERVALDRSLGRLWRGWKKRIRSPQASVSLPRSFSRESLHQQKPSGSGNIAPEETVIEESRRSSFAAVLAEFEQALEIPLPLSDNDIKEIEIPGLAAQSDDEDDLESEDEDVRPQPRPRSMEFFAPVESPTPDNSRTDVPIFLSPSSRNRSSSLPSPVAPPYRFKKAKMTGTVEQEERDPHDQDLQENAKAGQKDLQHPKKQTKAGSKQEDGPLGKKGRTAAAEAMVEPVNESETKVQPGENVEEPKADKKDNKGIFAGAVAGATALGAAAITGIVAAANGKAPVTDPDDVEENDVNEGDEEPQIMNSPRVSIGGGMSPENLPSRQSSARSHSVYSLRLIDVPGPKSPARSRHGSVGATDYIAGYSGNLSRTGSIQSHEQAPRVASPVSRVSTASPSARNGSVSSTRQLGTTEDSISEEKEMAIIEGAPSPADDAGAMQSFDLDLNPAQGARELPADSIRKEAVVAPFILSAPPVTRSSKELKQEHELKRTNLSIQPVDNGVPPPLTPLREMMEGAPDTSDEGSVATSNNARIGKGADLGHSPSASGSSYSQTHKEAPRSANQPTSAPRTSPPRSSPSRTSQDISRKPVPEALILTRSNQTASTSSNNSHKMKPVRTSEDSSRHTIEDKGPSFEELIRSDQTIQYTLTPQNMRNIESPDSPRTAQPTIVPNGVDARRSPTGRSHASSVPSKILPIQSNIQTEMFKPIARPSSHVGTKIRPNAPQARDARVDRDSLGDFAEFIRSTGPANENDAIPRPIQTHRGTNGTARNFSSSTPRTTTITLPRRAESSAGRSRLQAREAAVPRGDSISDLIDFVRSGPQLEKDVHRIPRTVAPFRNTMDSDQMSGAVGGKAIDATLPDRFSQTYSVESSANSQSALLGNASRGKSYTNAKDDEEDMMPKRKTRRARDPYAIDLPDEEEEFYGRPAPIQEESLADFLKNVPPPPDSSPAPIYPDARPTSKTLKKKSSTQSFRSRFSRKDSFSLPPKPKSNGNDSRTSSSRNGVPPFHTYTPIAAQYSTTPAAYEPQRNTNNYASKVDGARKVIQKSYQPRDAVLSNHRTQDLASFLMSSEPPTAAQTQPKTFLPIVQPKEGSTFQKMFGRNKVH